MNCLCCGKPLKPGDDEWHRRCIKRFFGTKTIPQIEINEDTLKNLVIQNTDRGFTVPGVQKKLSLHLTDYEKEPRLTLVNYPTGYILKPQTDEFKNLPEAEQLVMEMADISGIKTVPHALLLCNGSYSYITKRIDRIFEKNIVTMLAMEDFCQLDLRLTEDKYKGSYERCAKLIAKYSENSTLDLTEFFLRLVFCFIVGNSDMHLKNFSLIEKSPNSEKYILSPAYDLLPVNVIMPADKDQTALTLNGKKRNIRRTDFLYLAESCGILPKPAQKMIESLVSLKEKYIVMCKESLLPDEFKEKFSGLIEKRCSVL